MTKWLLSISLLFLSAFAFAQDEDVNDGNTLYEHDLDEEKWEDIRNAIRYEGREPGNGAGRQWTYESNREYNDARKATEGGSGGGSGGGKGSGQGSGSGYDGSGGGGSGSSSPPPDASPPPPPRSNPPTPSSSGGLSGLGYILLALFLVGLAVLIYYMYVNNPKDGTKVGAPIELEEVNPTEIPLTELERLLQEALAKKDYRGAIRIYFIFIIRDLAEKNWIQWEKEKTNFHYLREMAGKREYNDFNKSVSYFEIIWYGKREIDEEKFNQVKPNFTQFLDKLGVK